MSKITKLAATSALDTLAKVQKSVIYCRDIIDEFEREPGEILHKMSHDLTDDIDALSTSIEWLEAIKEAP